MFLLIAAAALAASALATNLVTIRNDIPRVDQFGHILNAHDGSVIKFSGVYFMYGTVYENCTQHGFQCEGPCGYSPNTFALYTSFDLQSWVFQTANILPEMAKDNRQVDYWMPVVLFNARTSQYVMQYWSGRCGFANPCADIAVASSPYGPFTMAPPLKLSGGTPSSQMGFFVDPATGDAFVKYNTHPPDQHHAVERLSSDWLSSSGEWATLLWKPSFAWMEGGGMFKRTNAKGEDLYYYMTGTDCEWGVFLFVSFCAPPAPRPPQALTPFPCRLLLHMGRFG